MTQVKIYCPNNADNAEKAHNDVRKALCDHFGGLTAYHANGEWVDDDGNVIGEPVTVFESYTYIDKSSAKGTIQHIAKKFKELTDEDSVAYLINHNMYFA